jgi:hypothetical protein
MDPGCLQTRFQQRHVQGVDMYYILFGIIGALNIATIIFLLLVNKRLIIMHKILQRPAVIRQGLEKSFRERYEEEKAKING